MSYTAIASQTLTSSASSVTFSSIPGTFRDLVLVVNGLRNTQTDRTLLVDLNGDWNSIYNQVVMYANPATSASLSNQSQFRPYPFTMPAVDGATMMLQITVFDYLQTDKHKSVLVRTDSRIADGENVTAAYAGRYASTNAITSLSINVSAGQIAAGATFNLFGIEA